VLLVEGILGVLAGGIAFAWPSITALALLYVVAAWAIVTGILEIAGAIRLRREIEGEWALGLSGALSLLFGVLLVVIPAPAGLLSLVWLIGAYALAFGVLLLVLAFRIRNMSGNDNTEADASSRPTAEQRFSEGNDLVSVSDSTPKDDTQATGGTREADPAQDVRGRDVRDRSGQEVGTVEDTYVDREGSTARFLVVGAAPGFNGRRFLIPTEVVSVISDEEVTLNQDRDKVADSPRFEGENGPDRQYQITIYRYYGYA
jgi:sporulation protein YlmC with PRC-barrel domain